MKKAISRIMIITILLSLSLVGNVFAGYEASSVTNPKVSTTVDISFENIRKMEAKGGTLGLEADIDQTTYLDKNKNGLDCHMIKNTEWGPIAMLTASQYGKVPASYNVSSTGNETGVYQLRDVLCYTTGILKSSSSSSITKLKAADPRYRDEYTSETGITGDATTETKEWYSGHAGWLSTSYPIFLRGYGSPFGYHFRYISEWGPNPTRAVVVCGTGL